MAKNWSDISPKQMAEIERAYKAGKEPIDIAAKYGLKAKQVSDQAYRKNWPKPGGKFGAYSRTKKKKAAGRRR